MAELIWEGKYDKDGKKVAPLRIPLPIQALADNPRPAGVRTLRGKDQTWRIRVGPYRASS